jgi:hypothetical protein
MEKTNKLISDLRDICSGEERRIKISQPIKDKILNRLEQEKGYVDYMSISQNILYPMHYLNDLEQFKKETLYNLITKKKYENEGYLQGVEIVHNCDYLSLFEKYKHLDNVVYVVDPPYLSTDIRTYSNKNYWKLTNYLDVLNVLTKTSYIYFTSNKSSILELLEWIEYNYDFETPFTGATKIVKNVSSTPTSSYQDIMIYKSI